MLLSEHDHMLSVVFDMECAFHLLSAVYGFSSSHVDEFDVWLWEAETAFECKLFDFEHLGIAALLEQVLLKISDILYLTRLSYTIAFLLEPPFPVKLHHFLIVIEYSHEQKKTTYDSTCASFTMITVKDSYSLRISCQKMGHLIANDEEGIEGRSFVVFPVESKYVFQDALVDSPTTDVDCDIFVIVLSFEKLSYCVDIVTIEFFNSGGWEGHCYNSMSYVGEVQVITVLFVSVFRSTYDLS